MSVFDVQDLRVGYGKLEIIHGISFKVENNELFVIVGPNGSGKSTLLKGLFGLASIKGGKIVFNGEDITRLPAHERSKKGLAYHPQLNNTFENLTVRENILLAGYFLDRDELERRLENVLEFLPEIRGFMDRKVRTLSGGERQMVAFAMNMIKEPNTVMFDEPTAALSPKMADLIFDRIVKLKTEYGLTVVLVEQNAKKALELGDRAMLLVTGTIKFLGAADELLSHEDLASMYLGLRD